MSAILRSQKSFKDKENVSVPESHKKRSSSTTRNPLSNTKIENGNIVHSITRRTKDSNPSTVSKSRDDDFELSTTLEKKAQLLQRQSKNLNNNFIFMHKYSAFVDD